MKLILSKSILAWWLIALAAAPVGIAQAADAPATKAATPTPALKADFLAQIPQAVFVIPASPREGRNPFFPRSQAEVPVVTPTKTDSLESATFVLNGITSPPRPTAMINGQTFDQGEISEVKLGNGSKVTIQCVEIRGDSAVILVNGQRRELRLRNGF